MTEPDSGELQCLKCDHDYNDITKNCKNECDIKTNEGCIDGIEECDTTTELSESKEISYTYCKCLIPEDDRDENNPEICRYEPNECHNGNGIDCNGNGKCVHLPGKDKKSCFCKITHGGEYCEDPITCNNGNPCLNSGSCQSVDNDKVYKCDCRDGFYGRNCEEIHPCHPFVVKVENIVWGKLI